MRNFIFYILPILFSVLLTNNPVAAQAPGGANVLRIYRLALPVAYNAFDKTFNKNVNSVKLFWDNAEKYLNQLYIRDIGIKFEVVRDERVISRDAATDPIKTPIDQDYAYLHTYRFLNDRIGSAAYDIGLFIVISNDANGRATEGGAYTTEGRANAAAGSGMPTIAHELGHLFGAKHTFSTGGISTNLCEPDRGTSIMSYGSPRTFFNLVSLMEISQRLSRTSYYRDRERVQLVDAGSGSSNYPFGVESSNQAPVIDRSKLKTSYTIPKNTFFQFAISASDADGDNLLYMAHQADKGGSPKAVFRAFPPTADRTVTFQSKYFVSPSYPIIPELPYTTPETTGNYSFLLGVSDGGNTSETHHTLYDIQNVSVNIVDGTPFKITSKQMQGEYKGGQKVPLEWAVDKTLFPDGSRVRILLSDDFGQTFKYVLKESAPNNGSAEVTLPNINIGRVKFKDSIDAGVIKIEAIDHIAYALTETNPAVNGFRIAFNTELGMPVSFGKIGAAIKNGQLFVNWITESETNNDHFIIEVSKDGKTWKELVAVKSKSVNGNSASKIEYSYNTTLGTVAALFAIPALLGIGLAGFGRRRKILLSLAVIALVVFGYSCRKQDIAGVGNNQKIWVRIAQVDNDGSKKYSTVEQAVWE